MSTPCDSSIQAFILVTHVVVENISFGVGTLTWFLHVAQDKWSLEIFGITSFGANGFENIAAQK